MKLFRFLFCVIAAFLASCEEKQYKCLLEMGNKVEYFSRKISVVCAFGFHTVLLTDCSVKTCKEVTRPYEFGQNPPSSEYIYGVALASFAANDRFIVCSSNDLGFYDMNGQLLQRHSLSEFNMDDSYTSFGPRAEIVDSTLYFTAYSADVYELQIAYWDMTLPPVKYRIIEPKLFEWNIHKPTHHLYVSGRDNGIYDIAHKKYIFSFDEYYSSVCANQNEEILLSGSISTDRDDIIYLLDYKNNRKEKLTWGVQAKWASDGNIYFIRGTNCLMRVNPGTKKVDSVFMSSPSVEWGDFSMDSELTTNCDGSVLVFAYRHNEGRDTFVWGLFILDLVTNEYTHISDQEMRSCYLNALREQDLSLTPLDNKSIEENNWVNLGFPGERLPKNFYYPENVMILVKSGY